MKEKFFSSWSGGKDSYLSLLKAKEEGLDIQYLLNFFGEEARSMSHGLTEEILKRQAEALGIPLIMQQVSWGSYQMGFVRVVSKLKEKGITGGVFGDINIVEHREWIEKMCGKLGLTACLPLWDMAEEDVLAELLKRKARLLIVSLDKKLLSREWLGKEIDQKFLSVCREAGITLCGERGEYHTLAIGGPLFRKTLEFVNKGSYEKEGKLFLEF
ncbi:MAG: diphthine--ammonia ligase [Desulfitobacteriaceae bacterium]|nr:diphthine--ammonia ligase [Desulfitobacteriaceae bacterium]MDD4347251.1 diphthine--ammonia ligase [Desulfitobacteriaceae bacterium]MDD4401045.1 diphthine--ammonia ligase [Desulfitobacteriaceae bacterium]